MSDDVDSGFNRSPLLPCCPVCSHVEEEDSREVPGPSGQADDDPEVTQFYVNPIAKPIPQGRTQTSLQDTISDLNMHKPARNGLEVRSLIWICSCVTLSGLKKLVAGGRLINRGSIHTPHRETTALTFMFIFCSESRNSNIVFDTNTEKTLGFHTADCCFDVLVNKQFFSQMSS